MGGCFVSSVTACTKGPTAGPDPLVHHGEGAEGRRCRPPQISRGRLAVIPGGRPRPAGGQFGARARARVRAQTDRGAPPPLWPAQGGASGAAGGDEWRPPHRRAPESPAGHCPTARAPSPPHFSRRPSWATDSSPDNGGASVTGLHPRPPHPPPPVPTPPVHTAPPPPAPTRRGRRGHTPPDTSDGGRRGGGGARNRRTAAADPDGAAVGAAARRRPGRRPASYNPATVTGLTRGGCPGSQGEWEGACRVWGQASWEGGVGDGGGGGIGAEGLVLVACFGGGGVGGGTSLVPFVVAETDRGRGGWWSTAVGRAAVTTAGRARVGTARRALGILFPPVSGRPQRTPPPGAAARRQRPRPWRSRPPRRAPAPLP